MGSLDKLVAELEQAGANPNTIQLVKNTWHAAVNHSSHIAWEHFLSACKDRKARPEAWLDFNASVAIREANK